MRAEKSRDGTGTGHARTFRPAGARLARAPLFFGVRPPMTDHTHAVVLARPGIDSEQIHAVAGIVSKATGMIAFDARALVQRARHGVLVGRCEPAVAWEVAERVRAVGIRAGAAPIRAAEAHGRRWPVLRGGCARSGLHADPGHQGMQRYEWSSVRAASVARFRAPVESPGGGGHYESMGKFLAGSGLFMGGLLGMQRTLPVARDLIRARTSIELGAATLDTADTYLLDLFLVDPAVTLRIDARRFSYAYLKDRMRDRCELNFHILVAQIAAGAPHARFAPTVERFLSGDLLESELVIDAQEIELYNRWFLLAGAADWGEERE